MKPVGIVGIILIVAGVILLIVGGIGYTGRKQLFKVGSVQASTKTHKTIAVPPVVGVVLLAGGIVLVVVGRSRA
ncbi:MAG: DUF3185 domain-containing protein [Terriglobia bacterium]